MLQLIALAILAITELAAITGWAAYRAGLRAGRPAGGLQSPLAVPIPTQQGAEAPGWPTHQEDEGPWHD